MKRAGLIRLSFGLETVDEDMRKTMNKKVPLEAYKESNEILNTAIDAGINFLDTGDVYADGEGERIIGRALKNNGKRHDILIATKVDHGEPQPGLPHGFAQSHLTKKSNFIHFLGTSYLNIIGNDKSIVLQAVVFKQLCQATMFSNVGL